MSVGKLEQYQRSCRQRGPCHLVEVEGERLLQCRRTVVGSAASGSPTSGGMAMATTAWRRANNRRTIYRSPAVPAVCIQPADNQARRAPGFFVVGQVGVIVRATSDLRS